MFVLNQTNLEISQYKALVTNTAHMQDLTVID